MTAQLLDDRRNELRDSEFGTTAQLLSALGRGDDPVAVMLTCWELGDAPDDVAHARHGEIIVVQNPAGIVPPFGAGDPGTAVATVCYGLTFPNVRHLIVCGHRECRMVPMLLSNRRPDLLMEFRRIVAEVRRDLQRLDEHVGRERRRELAVQKVVLQQLLHLKSYPAISRRLAAGELRLHGWLYDDATSLVQTFDPQTGRFQTQGVKSS